MIDDEKIIDLFFERSEQAIRELDIKYGKVCHNLSYNIVNSRQDAEECVNDAYLGAWNAIPPVHPNPLFAYIVKIVRNISLKVYWKKEAAKRNSNYTIALQEIEGCIADQKTVEDEIEARELARIIENFLDTLTLKERVIFMRRYAYMDTYADIAKRVGISEKNVSVRLTLIRQKLKQYLIERGANMNAKKFSEAINEVDDKYYEEAANYQHKKPLWLKWGAIAACLCVLISLGAIISLVLNQNKPQLLTTEGHLEIISVELTEWENNGFKAVVVDAGNSSIFPVGAELTVVFREHNTEIVLDDETSYGYGEIQTGDIEWPVSSIIEVSFGVYEKYDANRGYENKVYAYRVELAPQ